MSALETAGRLNRLAEQLANEVAGLAPGEAAAVQQQVGAALGALAQVVGGLAVSGGGAAAPMPAPTPAVVAVTPAPTAAVVATPAPGTGGGLKISLGGGSGSGGSAPGAITLGGSSSAPATPPPSGRGGLDVARGMAVFRDYIEKNQIAVVAADLAFTGKAVAIIEGLPEGERNSSKVAKLLGDCIGFIDKVVAETYAEGMEDLVRTANGVQKAIADFLHIHSIQVVPSPGEGVQAAMAAGAEQVEAFHAGSKGTPLAVARHGLKINGSLALKPAVLVSSGESSDLGKLIALGMAAVIKPRGAHVADAKLRAQALRELRNLTKQLAGSDEDKLRQVCQYAINSLHNCNVEKSLDGVVGKLVEYLKGGGYSEIYVGIGQKFDESYSPSKYERRKVSSDKELGTIIGVQQRGFLNKSGVPVQKAIVLVSG